MDNPNQSPWPPPPDPEGAFNPRSAWQEARRRAGMSHGPHADERIGDAERSEMADLLGKHYGDGRLDESEFRERLDRAMSAKTRGDLAGLLSDLPPLGQPEVTAPPLPPRRGTRMSTKMRTLALVLLGLVFLRSLGPDIWPFHVPWLLIAIVAFAVMRHRRWHHHGLYGGGGRHLGWLPGQYRRARWGGPPSPQQHSEGTRDRAPFL